MLGGVEQYFKESGLINVSISHRGLFCGLKERDG
jgi:hypothetical protein